MSDEETKQSNTYVGIAGTIGGISVAIVAVIAIFSAKNLYIAAWIVGALALMGIVLGAFASKAKK